MRTHRHGSATRAMGLSVGVALVASALAAGLAIAPGAFGAPGSGSSSGSASGASSGAASSSASSTPSSTVTPTPTPTPVPTPSTPTSLPSDYDVDVTYEGQGICDPTPKPGAIILAQVIKDTYPAYDDVWIPRDCSYGGKSEHKEGRAVDWMINVRKVKERRVATAFLDWLLAEGPDGTPHAMARRIGVMYIGWDSRIWRGYGLTAGWDELRNCFSTPERSYDNTCHRNHIHISLSWDGAAARTSFFDGTATTGEFCRSWDSWSPPTFGKAGLDLTPIRPVRVLDTRTGLGASPGRCRVQQSSYGGYGQMLVARVAGIGSIPSTGVRAVLARVSGLSSNAPTHLTAWGEGDPLLRVPMTSSGSTLALLPVSADGTISIANEAGSIDVAVTVVGYLAAPPTAESRAEVGTLRVGAPAARTAIVTVAPLSSRRVALANADGTPLTGVSTALLAVTTSRMTGQGNLAVVADAASLTALTPRTRYVEGSRRTTSMMTSVSADGSITVVNEGRSPVRVRIDQLALGSPAAPSLGRIVPIRPTTLLEQGLSQGALVEVQTRDAVGVRRNATAVLLQVMATADAPGWITAWSEGDAPSLRSVGLTPGIEGSSLIAVPIGTDGKTRWLSTVDADVTAYVVGYVR